MSHPHDVSHIFNKFAGKEVPMTVTSRTMNIGGQTYTFNDVQPARKDDPVLKAMHAEAKKNGLSLRVMWEGMAGTADLRLDRANASIEKSADGKWRVSSRFTLG